jgi:arabinogalactan endo-1,4-beta-galactosidase
LLVDFHFSDTWADPGHQTKPAAWANLTFTQLTEAMHDYTSNCLTTFQAAGAPPDYVQLGNEITGGLLWPDGRVGGTNDTPAQWSQLGQLLKAAAQGIRDACGGRTPPIIIHLDRGGDWSTTQWFFDNLNQQGVAYDIIGESYYPFWHGPLSGLANCLTNAARRYGRPVLVAETAFPWTNSYWTTNLDGLAPGVTSQVQYAAALAQVVQSVPNRLGGGIYWWGAEYQKARNVNEAGYDTTSFFDSNGNLLPVADALAQAAAPLELRASLNGQVLTLSWPLSGAYASLMGATQLPSAGAWTMLTNAIQSTDTGFNLTLPMAGPQRFYRLQSGTGN